MLTLNVTGSTTDRKSTRLNSSHLGISYAVFCLKKTWTKNSWSRFCKILLPCQWTSKAMRSGRSTSTSLASLLCRKFFFNDTATPEIYTLSLPRRSSDLFYRVGVPGDCQVRPSGNACDSGVDHLPRSEEHTSELQSLRHLVCRLLLEK